MTGAARTDAVAAKLSSVSVARYANPHALFDWPERPDPDRLAMTDDLVTLAGHPLLATLPDETRWRLHLLEAAHFFSINVAGEKELLLGLAARLHRGRPSVSDYLQHFLHEENAHTVVFVRFCRQYAGKIYPYPPLLRSPRESAPGEDDFLFWARVLVFEEIANHYNLELGRAAEIWAPSRQINEYHALDEARHIAFGRVILEELWEQHAPRWDETARARVRDHLRDYVAATLRSYVSPAVYRDAKLGVDALALREEVFALPSRRAVDEASTRRVTAWLRELGALA